MKVIFSEQYKSIKSLPELDLPDFTILTGVNGAGKTHLLEGVSSGKIRLEIGNRKANSIIHFNYQDFIFQHSMVQQITKNPQQKTSAGQIKKFIDKNETAKEIQIAKAKIEKFYVSPYDNKEDLLIEQHVYKFIFEKLFDMPVDSLDRKSTFDKIAKDFLTGAHRKHFEGTDINAIYLKAVDSIKNIKEIIKNDDIVNRYYFVAKRAGISMLSLKADQVTYSEGTLGEELMKEFRDYRYQQFANDVQKARSERESHTQYLSGEQFRVQHGMPPWELLSQVLKEYGCNDYLIPAEQQLPYPDLGQKVGDFYIPLNLVNQRTHQFVTPEGLSSGEKTLLALALVVYRQKKMKQISLSDVLLLDEIDGNLHPSMIQQLLNVLENIFIKEYGMKIILVTHSPTTIALAPDRSIFIMHREGECTQRVEKKDKGEALGILTEGYATLDEGLRLFDQIANKKVSIITEGWNIEYLRKANEFFGDPNEIEIITGAEGISGKNQLKTLYDFFIKIGHKNKVFFVWDCDVKEYDRLEKSDTTIPYVFQNNNENKVVKSGIENLFPQKLVDKSQFYGNEKINSGGTKYTSLDKNKLREYLIEHGSQDDFIKFKPLFESIKEK